MVPAIRNILGGFLFSGDDVYKRVRVLSGGERTRLAVARMLLRPSNTLLLDEPTNHLDLDSKEVLLDALVDYGGTLIFVSHDRYFVERLATKIIEVGNGTAVVYPGTYDEFLWHKEHRAGGRAAADTDGRASRPRHRRADDRRRQDRRHAGSAAWAGAHDRVGQDGSARTSQPRPDPRREKARTTPKPAGDRARKQARRAQIERARSADRRDRAGDPRARAEPWPPRVSTTTGPPRSP